MTNREIAQEISNRIGNRPVPFNSVYSIALQIYNELGGEETQFDSVYSILLEILPLVEGGGGKAIEEVDELPEASENTDKFYRVEGEDGIYAAKLLSSESITTNRLPDAQQIDKAYLYTDGDICYYKGSYKVILTDGEIDGYGWIGNDGYNDYISITLNNAVDISDNSVLYGHLSFNVWNIDEVAKTITNLSYTIEDFVGDYESTISDDGLIPISATYNAPESAQIGNAYCKLENLGSYTYVYTGVETTIEVDEETLTVYKWDNGDDNSDFQYCFTTKPASEMYFNGDSGILTDVKCYLGDGDEATFTSLYIPQLNAPDSEQVGNAYIDEKYMNDSRCVYTGEQTTIEIDNTEISVYEWISEVVPENPIYTTKPAYQIYNTNSDSINVSIYMREDENTITEITFAEGQIEDISTVKYQREEVIEEWGWEVLAYYDELADKISEKANQTDFVVPVDMTTQAYDWSALDSFNTTGFYKGIAHADYMGMSLDFAAIQLSVVTASPVIIQTVAMYTFLNGVDNIQMGSRQSTDGGTTWTTMTESMLPSLNDDASVTSAVANKTTYSRSKIDSLIHALDVRLNALEGNTTVE